MTRTESLNPFDDRIGVVGGVRQRVEILDQRTAGIADDLPAGRTIRNPRKAGEVAAVEPLKQRRQNLLRFMAGDHIKNLEPFQDLPMENRCVGAAEQYRQTGPSSLEFASYPDGQCKIAAKRGKADGVGRTLADDFGQFVMLRGIEPQATAAQLPFWIQDLRLVSTIARHRHQ